MEGWSERTKGILFFILIALTIAGVVVFQVLRPEPLPMILESPTPPPLPSATPTPRPLRVYVSGAVHNPDVYTLPPDSIVKDAIVAAGGATDQADLDRINLASPLADGQHIYVPHRGEENPPVQSPSKQPSAEGKVNINTAGQAELEMLPGIGPGLAKRIVDYRQAHGPFARIEEIMNVSGIGPALFEKIRDLITTQ